MAMANIISSTELLGARLLREVESEEGGLEAVSSNFVTDFVFVFLRLHLISSLSISTSHELRLLPQAPVRPPHHSSPKPLKNRHQQTRQPYKIPQPNNPKH